MKNIVYSKYSNERSQKFQIRTDILEDENGKRYVQKSACTFEANNHINNIHKNYKLLLESYKDSKICINKCSREENRLEFEYIVGDTLEKELDKLLLYKDYNQLIKVIEEYVSIIGKGIGKSTFKLTKEFIEVFGNVDLPLQLRAGEISDIDLVFSNIIVGDRWHVIDYEWTFNFPIPFNYIIYRAIRVYLEGSTKRNELAALGIYKLFGITENEIIQYSNMEESFQNYVTGYLVPLNKLYGYTTEMNLNIHKIIEYQRANLLKNTVQVFYDKGKGFCEEDSYKFYPLLNGSGKVKTEILVTPNIRKIRIDPTSNNCIINIGNIVGYTTRYYAIDYYTNGIELLDNFILFTNDDPQIIIEDIRDGTIKIIVEFEIETIADVITIKLCGLIEKQDNISKEKENEIKEKENEIKEKENEIKEKENEIKEKNKHIMEIETSKTWKYMQKFKRIIGK